MRGLALATMLTSPPRRFRVPGSTQREQALEGEPRVPGNAPQCRRSQTNALVIREGQLTAVSVPQHAHGVIFGPALLLKTLKLTSESGRSSATA